MELIRCGIIKFFTKIKNEAKQSPVLILKDILNKIPGRPIQTSKFLLLELFEPIPKIIRGIGVVREGVRADIAAMCMLQSKEAVFSRRFSEGEFCTVAVYEDQIIGYVWYSDKELHLEDRFKYRLNIPDDAIYGYDGFIKREYRLGGTWPVLMGFILDKTRSLGRKKVIVMIDYGNDQSLNAHLRFGFKVYMDVIWIKFFARNFYLETTVDRNR